MISAPNLKDSVEARLWFFNLAGLLAAMLLGCAVGPALPPFLWLAAARLLSALLLMMLPPTALGLFRPYLAAGSLLCLLLAQVLPAAGLANQLALGLLFLLIDPSLDALLAQRCPEHEWLGRMGQLLTARMAGLVLGLGLSGVVMADPAWGRLVVSVPLLTLILLFALTSEGTEPEERPGYGQAGLIPETFRPRRLSSPAHRLDTLRDSLQALAQPVVLQSLSVLLAVAVLAGGSASALYPVPMLSESVLRSWLNHPGLPLGLAAACALLALALERLSRQSLRAIGYSVTLLTLTAHLARPGDPGFLAALQLASGLALLVAHRQTLAAQIGVDPCLRGSVPLMVWTAGMLTGEVLIPTPLLNPSRLLCATVLLLSLLATIKHWKVTTVTEAEVLDDREPGRHGDRAFDFVAGPSADHRRRRGSRLRRVWHYLTIRFPVTLTLVVLGSFAAAATWHASDNKKSWEEKTRGVWLATQTNLFLTSLKLRTEEEMLASSRVPDDWAAFIAANFELDGRPMKDRDFWGTPLHFDVLPKEVRIVSAGPDRKLDTPDDLQRSARRPDGVVER